MNHRFSGYLHTRTKIKELQNKDIVLFESNKACRHLDITFRHLAFPMFVTLTYNNYKWGRAAEFVKLLQFVYYCYASKYLCSCMLLSL